MLTLIAAIAPNRVIGQRGSNRLPWYIPDEMRFFRETTIKNVVIMGWGTFDSIGRCPLPRRINIVLTRKLLSSTMYHRDNLLFATDIQDAINKANQFDAKTFVVGGAAIYKQFIEEGLIDAALISHIKALYSGDVHFPCPNIFDEWEATPFLSHELFDVVQYVKSGV